MLLVVYLMVIYLSVGVEKNFGFNSYLIYNQTVFHFCLLALTIIK